MEQGTETETETAEPEMSEEEEASLMIGQDITVSEDMFTTYDNYRLPTSSWSRQKNR